MRSPSHAAGSLDVAGGSVGTSAEVVVSGTFGFKSLPEGVVLNPLSQQVFEILSQHTSFPWPVMQAQCRREEVDPANLTRADLARVIDNLASAVARFTSPENATKVADALRPLALSRAG